MTAAVATNSEAVDIVNQMRSVFNTLQNNPRFSTTPSMATVVALHSSVTQYNTRGLSANSSKATPTSPVRFSLLILERAYWLCFYKRNTRSKGKSPAVVVDPSTATSPGGTAALDSNSEKVG